MRVIPVLDLKAGVVVRAQGGQRETYRRIVTPLSRDADVVNVANGLRSLHPFDTVYVADLDAIAGGGIDLSSIRRLCAQAGLAEIWVDSGVADADSLQTLLDLPRVRPVIGSESQSGIGLLERHRDDPRVILSLDFFAEGFRGPAAIHEDSALWPETLIVMTLGHVGRGAGPDIGRLVEIAARAGSRKVVAAGGVRDANDLRQLKSMRIDAALVATALHTGTITGADLARLA